MQRKSTRTSKKRASDSVRKPAILQYIRKRPVLRVLLHFLLFLILVLVAFLCVDRYLVSYTRYGQEITVPDFNHLTMEEAYELAAESDLRLEVVDSVFSKTDRGLVRKQDPEAGSVVKKGRRVFITINAKSVRIIPMPNLVGYSLRQAILELERQGLSLRNIRYRSDLATNNVLGQLYDGRPIEPGESIETASEVDLIVGLNRRDNIHARVPNLLGKSAEDAKKLIHDSYLNINSIEYARGIRTEEDRAKAVVYMQVPEPIDSLVEYGAGVTIFLDRIEHVEEVEYDN